MKKIIFILALSVAAVSAAFAQNRKIEFESTRTWAKVVEKAKAENKLIFVDCYTDWCAPCKKLAATVFTQDKVADFFNENFVNAKFEMEKDADGKAHMKAWGVTAYPTMMFIDPNTEAAVGKISGFVEADQLIKAGQTALDPENRLDRMIVRYEAGERSPRFIMNFCQGLKGAGMGKEAEGVMKNYLNTMPLDSMTMPANWAMIMQYEHDPLSPALLTIKSNIETFYAMPMENQKTIVDAKLTSSMVGKAIEYATNPNLALYDAEHYNAFIDYVASGEVKGSDIAAVWLNTSSLSRKGDWKQMIEVMRAVQKEEILPPQLYGQYFQTFMLALVKMEDKHALPAGIAWIDEQIAAASGEDLPSYYVRFQMNVMKCHMFQLADRPSDFQKAAKEGEKYGKLIESLKKQ